MLFLELAVPVSGGLPGRALLQITFRGLRRRESPASAGRSGVRRPSRATPFPSLRRPAAARPRSVNPACYLMASARASIAACKG
jgi:hypothetical protein